ncbi:Bifunctional inhibitor/lipid-transfer protein/seed storage 2S albumin superfamily protein [Raphanus sativus]|uniref:Non-specific lipid-transfer protein 2-like n=1 Tax=Raphanus sativus TaxID=3726 RepID=A0A6J0NEM8_RAPSA|nr:non-specific lipid-transfer protein 2-like [Raphanus sativus]KAJ4901572.1 Bifunctional inhibitor/lipid-transfer protein/seed storage 2S albumin superfamily protein [Raphanus sativus]
MCWNPISMKFTGLVCIAFVIVLVSALAPTKAVLEEKAECIPTELLSCLPAIQTGSQPTADCCGKLKEQESCLCGYIRNPLFSQYVTSENAHKTLASCGIPYPTC